MRIGDGYAWRGNREEQSVKLKLKYASEGDIPEGFAALYTEKDGEWHLTEVEGIKTDGDIAKVRKSLETEREAHKKTKDRMRHFIEMSDDELEETVAKLDKYDELEAAAGDKLDEDKINELAEKRANALKAPLERDLKKANDRVTELEGENGELKTEKRTRTIHDAVRKVATEAKVIPEAMEDVLMHAERVFEINDEGEVVVKDAVGFTPGVGADVWMTDIKDKRPFWFPTSSGGGGKGSGTGPGIGGNNPWSHANWNMTEQGRIVRADPKKAEQLATAAGTKVGGTRPAAP